MDRKNIDKAVAKSHGRKDVRAAFIEAGLELFGNNGLEGASTRMLAKRANANISGIVYYFGGKDGLYQAVLESIVEYFNSLTGEIRREAWRQLENPLQRPHLLGLIKNLIAVMAGGVLDDRRRPKNAEKLILREQTSPTAAFAVLYEGYMKDLLHLMAVLVARYTERPVDCDDVVIRSHTLIGQVVAFISTREALLKNLGVKRLGAEQNELINKTILANVEACLKTWAAEGKKS